MQILRKMVILALALAAVSPQAPALAQGPKIPEAWLDGARGWPKVDWMDLTAKRLEKAKGARQPGPEIELLQARAADLLERARSSTDNQFRFERLIGAVNSLLDAADRIAWARKAERTPQEKDFWGAGFVLQGCYFRVRQADYFAALTEDKKSEQVVTLARSLYQQGRGAHDAREYQRARLLADASSLIVFALESIAQATIPDPHIYR